MSDPSLVILAAVIFVGRNDAGVAAAFGARAVSVWETPPHGGGDPTAEAYPFARVGELQVNNLERLELDQGDDVVIDDPAEVFVTIHVFSQRRGDATGGKPEAIRIASAFASALARPDEIALEHESGAQAFRLVLCEIQATRHFTDPDGVTAHSVLTARFELEPTEG